MKNTEFYDNGEQNFQTAVNTTLITKQEHTIVGAAINPFTAVSLNLTAVADGPVTINALKVQSNIAKTPVWECCALKSSARTVAVIKVMFLMMVPLFPENGIA